MKSLDKMDLEDWELLPGDGFLKINDDGGKKTCSRKYHEDSSANIQMNYFICPPKSLEKTEHQIPLEIKITPSPVSASFEKIKSFSVADQDSASQVLFKKMMETEFVDMKVESPKSSSSRGIMPQMDFHFEEKKEDVINCNETDTVDHSEMVMMKKNEKNELDHEHEGGMRIWKLSLTGIGAICSFGVAVATFCVISFSSQRRNKQPQQNQKASDSDLHQSYENEANGSSCK